MKMRLSKLLKMSIFATAGIAAILPAQTVRDSGGVPDVRLNLPSTITPTAQRGGPMIHRATAIINGYVVTATDVDQRLGLIVFANGGKISDQERARLRTQILSNIIDETLQIQEAKANDIEVSKREIDATYANVAARFKQTPAQMSNFLKQNGSSERSLRRQIEGEIAWSRLLNRRVSPNINVSDEEVKSTVKRLLETKGTTKYRYAEIFLSATPETAGVAMENAQRIMSQLRSGGDFCTLAQQFSESTTSARCGDGGWVRPSQLPTELGSALPTMQIGQIAGPIAVGGGVSILHLVDTQQVLGADPRDTIMTLRQLSITFPKDLNEAQAKARFDGFAAATKSMGGCGGSENIAKQFNGEIVDSERAALRELQIPAALQSILLGLQVGQATPPFGSREEGARVLIVCGRDEPRAADLPNDEDLRDRLQQERVNRRAQVYLRDLRRDAVIDYR